MQKRTLNCTIYIPRKREPNNGKYYQISCMNILKMLFIKQYEKEPYSGIVTNIAIGIKFRFYTSKTDKFSYFDIHEIHTSMLI